MTHSLETDADRRHGPAAGTPTADSSMADGSTAGADRPYTPGPGVPLRAERDPAAAATGQPADGRASAVSRLRGNLAAAVVAVVLLAVTALVILAPGDGADNTAGQDNTVGHDTTAGPDAGTGTEGSGQGDPTGRGPDPDGGGFPASTGVPAGIPIPEPGSGTYRVVPGVAARVGAEDADLFTYTVEVEDSVDTTVFGGDDSVAAMVDATLSDPRSWTANGTVAFQRVGPDAEPEFRVTLVSPLTVRQYCGYTIEVEVSCFNPAEERTFINVARWANGARSFDGDIGSYRQYLINHEVGHAIGFPGHDPCPANAAPAPIMMQQTLSLRNSDIRLLEGPESYAPDDDATCLPNPWPFTPGALNPMLDGPVP